MAKHLTFTILLSLQFSVSSAFGQYVTVISACTRDVTKFCQAARNSFVECIDAHFQDFHEQCRTALVETATVREALQSGYRAAMS
jgi:hypothetical protein